MKTHENDKSESKKLRQKAEEELKTRKSTNSFSEVDNLKLVHELQVHQIELEMQNEELVKAREQAEAAMEKYVDLYDFAPSGYVTLSEEGNIIDLNFSAASMLGNDRVHLKNNRFGLYVSPYSLIYFNQLFERAFTYNQKETCELLLLPKTDKKDKLMYIYVDALVTKNTNKCLFTMIDISERKKMEVELIKTTSQLRQLNSYFMDRELRMMDLKNEINELLIKSGCEQEYKRLGSRLSPSQLNLVRSYNLSVFHIHRLTGSFQHIPPQFIIHINSFLFGNCNGYGQECE